MAKRSCLVDGQQSGVDELRGRSHRLLGWYLPIIIVLLVSLRTRAEIAARHEGANDPLTERWTKYRPFLDVRTLPVKNDLGFGIDAWSINDTKGFGPGGHDGLYGVTLSNVELLRAEKAGSRFTLYMRIVHGGVDKVDDAITAAAIGRSLRFGRTKTGKSIVRLDAEGEDKVFELEDLNGGYHLYELICDPKRKSVRFYIDRGLRDERNARARTVQIDNKNPRVAEDGDVYFGSTSNNFTSQANYARVLFEIAPRDFGPTAPIVRSTGSGTRSKKSGQSTRAVNRVDKLTVPNAEDVYREGLDKARTLEQKRALARTLLKYGLDTKDDANGRYILFQIAEEFAMAGGDLDTALQAIDLMEEEYAIDVLASKLESLKKFVNAPNQRQHSGLVVTTSDLMDEAIRSDRFELAREFGKLALASARKSRAVGTVQQLASQLDEIHALEKEYSASQAATIVLVEAFGSRH